MQRRTVHGSPLPFTADTADLPVRSLEAATVHGSSRRTVTSLVTSPPGATTPTRRTMAQDRVPAGPVGAPIQGRPEPGTRRRATAPARAGGPARTGADAGERRRRCPGACGEQRARAGQCTPPTACRTASARARHTEPGTAASRRRHHPGTTSPRQRTARGHDPDRAAARLAGPPQPIAAEAGR
jgi:hypothetical protein